MVALTEIRSSNAALKAQSPGTVSVFVGGTSGIGAATLKQLAISTNSPNIYIVGRSQAASSPQLDELKALNPAGSYTFIEAQVSLLKEVDRACAEIKSKEQKIDLLWLSQGALSLNGRQDTSEGLALNLALTYYGRTRFVSNLLPQLLKSPRARVVYVLAAGEEGAIATDDLELKTHYSLANTATQGATMSALALDELARENPSISFVYTYPGFVATDLVGKMLGGVTGWLGYLGMLAGWVLGPIVKLISMSPTEAGERGLYESTSERFGTEGTNYWRLDGRQEPARKVEQLDKYTEEGWPKKVWEHTVGVFERITSS